MPGLVSEHVKAPAQHKLPHTVKGKPEDQIGELRGLTGCNIGLDAVVELADGRVDFVFVLDERCGSW
jgi:hypothetical protein